MPLRFPFTNMSRNLVSEMLSFLRTSKGFEACIRDLQINTAKNGLYQGSLKTSECHNNPKGTVHGGLLATLADVAGVISTASTTPDGNLPFTLNLDVRFIKNVKANEEIFIEGQVIKFSQNLGFVQVALKNSKGDLVLTGNVINKVVPRTKNDLF